jgi:hypothetical protein
MFDLGGRYTRRDIHEQLGGSLQSFLPTVEGQVVCACLRTDTNPDAPEVILVGSGPIIRQSAEALWNQRSVIPVFLKREAGKWEFVGHFRVDRVSDDPDERSEWARRAEWESRPSLVLHMLRVTGAV